ncbi:MAG TPA: ChaN family lipoprotein [Gammaproteobacteria bacterium]|nr:ChaN family lipoprotein [Gammaproteobacteria bacterium]
MRSRRLCCLLLSTVVAVLRAEAQSAPAVTAGDDASASHAPPASHAIPASPDAGRAAADVPSASFYAIDLSAALTPAELAARLDGSRAVFVGETHTRYDDHLNQLAIIEQLHEHGAKLAIGVEYFERRVQPHIDDYIEGRIDEREFLRATEYFQAWGFDYRLYAPIFRYARREGIPVRALNVPRSLPPAVASVGVAGLSAEQRSLLPKDIEPAGEAYEARLRSAFEGHGGASPGDFEHFVEAQLVWDEGMAESAADYLASNPDRRMVVLAGSGHVAYGSGIPERLARRTHASYAIVLNAGEETERGAADFLLLGPERELPPAGVLGASFEDRDGKCRIRSVAEHGAAAKSGLKKGDVLVSIDGQPVSSAADVRVALWDKVPGDAVRIEVRRKRGGRAPLRIVNAELEAPAATRG